MPTLFCQDRGSIKVHISYSLMKPAEAKRLAELAGCTGDSWKAKSIQQLWAGMGHIYELQCGDERIVAKVVKLPKRCDSVGDRRKARSYECEAAFYSQGYATQLLDADVVVPRPLHVEARADGVTIVMSRLDGRPGAFDRRGTETALAALAKLHACFWGPRADAAVAGGLQAQGTMWCVSWVRNVDVPPRWSLHAGTWTREPTSSTRCQRAAGRAGSDSRPEPSTRG